MFKLIASDLDRTLLTSQKQLSPITITTLKEIQKRGYPIVFASAHHYLNILPFLSQVKADYVIASNGAGLLTGSGDILGEEALDPQLVLEILADLDTKSDIRVRSIGSTKDYLWSEVRKPTPLKNWQDCLTAPALTLTLQTKNIDYYREYFAKDSRLRVYSYIEEDFMSVLSAKTSKFHGMEKLLEKLQLDFSEIVFFGDDENDLDLLKASGKSIAVANAIPAALKIAQEVTDTNDQDGVATWLTEHFPL